MQGKVKSRGNTAGGDSKWKDKENGGTLKNGEGGMGKAILFQIQCHK